jgi:hypothetical protein
MLKNVMRTVLMIALLRMTFFASAQDGPCTEKIQAKKDEFAHSKIQRNGKPNYTIHKKLIDAVHAMMQLYEPIGVHAKWGIVHNPAGQAIRSTNTPTALVHFITTAPARAWAISTKYLCG